MNRWLKYELRAMLFCLLLLNAPALWATHQRAGEISYTYISGLTYEFTIVTYTYTPSLADRPEIEVYWGDGTSSIITRTQKVNMNNDISKNVYVSQHTFSAAGTFYVSFEDPNRNAGIVNIPSSVEIPFFIETIIVINPFIGGNSSPQLMNPPIDNGCTNVIYYHNPGAYDADGDSLSYSLITCRGENGEDIPGYSLPAASNAITIDPVTGDLVWDSPMMAGEYNIAILITEWRNGLMISSMVRDMQITIAACNNQPPEIEVQDTCVLAGAQLVLSVTVTDNTSTEATLSATGAPLYVADSPAQFMSLTDEVPFTTNFVWNTQCSHVQLEPYTVLFRAQDNGPHVELVAFKTLHIRVVAPQPENLQATPQGNMVQLSWQPDGCTNAIGYDIYRRNGPNPFVPDHCETGMPADEGYSWIGQTFAWEDTTFTDENVLHGNDYCYRVVALFADGSESYVSDEVCTHIICDAPMLTHTDVLTTDSINGTLRVRWVRPPEIDSVAFPPPYYYYLYRKNIDNSFQQLTTTPISAINDTTEYLDHDLNTEENDYTYYVQFLNEDTIIESSDAATSIYLTAQPSDRKVHLSWHVSQPWNNVDYTVYRYDETAHYWDSIATTQLPEYTDLHLTNGEVYCYYVCARGYYWQPDTMGAFYNRSQRCCASPIDDTPPELPALAISTDCNVVNFQWQFDADSVAADAYRYYFYYKPTLDADFQVIDSVTIRGTDCVNATCDYALSGADVIVGCFAMAVADTNGNLSALSDTTCIDIYECLDYRLPNIFTPNGDGVNDLFVPFEPYHSVTKVDMQIYNRWGRRVFHTSDPAIRWDGTSESFGNPCSDGVFFYGCEVFVNTLTGQFSYLLNGSITLIR